MNHRRIAVVYDWFDKWGGVERVLLTMHGMFPQAVFFSSYYDPINARWAKKLSIRTSFMQKLPQGIRNNRILSVPVYPFAFESLDFKDFDIVISVTSSFAKAVITKPGTIHLCYLLTPTRFLWSHMNEYIPHIINKAVYPYMRYLRKWDVVSAQRPDHLISISNTVHDRCINYYKRESEIIYPPFDMEYWDDIKLKIKNFRHPDKYFEKSKYFLVVSRLEPYKKVNLVIDAFNKTPDKNLIIVGKGSLDSKLHKIAGRNVIFMPYVTDTGLARLYSNAEALIIPQEEDFGYVSLEAQFFGCPVIAYKKGGVVETVKDNKTGIFFEAQNSGSIIQALDHFHTISYNLKIDANKLGIDQCRKFGKPVFVNKFNNFIDNLE